MMNRFCSSLLLSFLLIGCGSAFGQGQASMDFSWTDFGGSSYTSDTTLFLCEGQPVTVTLTTSLQHSRNWNGSGPLSAGHPGTSTLVPSPTLGLPLTMVTTLSFSVPVANLRVLIRDLDDDVPAAGPEETFGNFLVNGSLRMPDAIQSTQGSFSTAGNVVTPLNANCNGWYVWNGLGIQSMAFTYNRDTDHYAFLLDSLQISCDNSLGIEAPSDLQGFDMFPNPANGQVNLIAHTPEGIGQGACTLEVLDVEGRQAWTRVVASAEFTKGYALDFNDLSSGIYLVRLTSTKGRFTKKLVVLGAE